MIGSGKLVLALIPARGGSKGVPRKNMAMIDGHPLIEYTLQAAQNSTLIDDVWISSDDEEIIDFSRKKGVRVIQRPNEFSGDHSTANEVVQHFISMLPTELRCQDPYIIYLQPTSPLRTAGHIDQALMHIDSKRPYSILSVVEVDYSPYKAFRIDSDGKLQSLFDEKLSNTNRQDLPITYRPNGAIYVFLLSEFEKRAGIPSNGGMPFIMSKSDSVDIDTPSDLINAEKIIRERNG